MENQDILYMHTGLQPGFIRVLELQPATSTDSGLACHLTAQRIGDTPYEALSYVWGKPTVFQSMIWCKDMDGHGTGEGVMHIGANLATALLAYRLPDAARRLWVDAICIQQEDLDERLSQVRMMGDIFRNATQVLCWLGAFQEPKTHEALAKTAIKLLREFNKDQQFHLQQIQTCLHRTGKGIDSTTDIATAPNHDQPLLDSWHAIKVFFDCEYFHRAWIIQEIGLARQAWISWGRRDICIDWTEIATFVLFLDDNGASVINALDLKSWVCNHINLVWSNNADGTPIYDFTEVLHWARVHLSTDPRDFVYSLLGHPSAVVDGTRLIEPVYSISTREVYTNLVVNTVQRTRSLHMLAFVDHGEEKNALRLPTWVPDWHALNLVAPLRCPTRASTPKYNDVSIDTDGSGGGQENPTLHCRGVVVSDIRAFSSMISPKELAVTDYAAEMKKTIPFLADHLYETLVSTQDAVTRPSAAEFIAALSFILTGAHRGTAHAASGDARQKQQADCAAHIVKAEALRAGSSTAQAGPFFHSMTEEERAYVHVLASDGSATQIVQDMTWTSMCRRVFITTSGHLGLGPRIIAQGDVVAIVPGSKYPLVLRGMSDAKDTHELVGAALLCGFMDNQVETASPGNFTEQEFCLV